MTGQNDTLPLDLEDDEYRRLFDSLARFYNSQITAHVGYFLTSVVAYVAVFSMFKDLLYSSFVSQLGDQPASILVFSLFVLVGVAYCLFPIPYPPFPVYLLARTQYYVILSELAWSHMGVNEASQRQFCVLKDRALQIRSVGDSGPYPLGLQHAVQSMFEAALYCSYVNEDKRSAGWQEVFRLETYIAQGFNPPSYTSEFVVWKVRYPLKSLLRIAYRIRIDGYVRAHTEEVKEGRAYEQFDEKARIGALFEKAFDC